MVLEPETSGVPTSPKGGGLRESTLIGEGNETFLIRVRKPLPNRHVLKTLRGSPKKTISASGGLGCYKI